MAKPKPTPNYNTFIPPEILTPDEVETSIGTLEFQDGAPLPHTAERVYEYLDTMRGVDAFLKGMPGASLQGLIKGARSQGAVECHQVLIFDRLMDSNSLYLTGNTSTMYVLPNLDLKRDGPTVLEAPPGMLGAFNDAWFRYVQDIGPAGPDKGQGGRYLVLPPDYEGEVPEGYFVVQPRTYDVWVFMRASIAKGLETAAKNVKDNLRIYPLAREDNPPKMEFISASGKSTDDLRRNEGGSVDHYFGPEAPEGFEQNWIKTKPGEGWFTLPCLYAPLEPILDKTWR